MLLPAWIAALLLLLPQPAPGQKSKQPKPPEVVVVHIKAQREGRRVIVDGNFRNGSGRPLRGLVIFIEFIESGGQMISRKNTVVSEEELAPGEEGGFEVQTPDPVRAVWYRLEAEDAQGRNLTLDKPGPYPIE